MDRRNFLIGAGLGLTAATAPERLLAAESQMRGLQAHAAEKGLAFGTSVNITSLRHDPLYGPLLAANCGIAAAENEMKMEYAWPEPERFDFKGGDETLAFAQKNGMKLRGSPLVWHSGMPSWAIEAIPSQAERIMSRWITTIVGRYRGQVESWDVVNEITDHHSDDCLRKTVWRQALGPEYVSMAFQLVKEADPSVAGVWNEEDVELDAKWMEQRRACVLKTLDALLARKTPIKRFGLQSHLNSLLPLNQTKLRKFLAEIASRGVAIEITELDVDDRIFPSDIAVRDAGVAEFVKSYLDVVLDEPAVLNVLTYDVLDANTWYNNSARRRPDGLAQRSSLYDANYAPKPIWSAIEKAFDAAPDHSKTRAALRSH